MITISNVCKKFGDLEVLKGIDISVKDGEIYGIIGQSGAGKSTLLNLLGGMDKVTSGSIKIGDNEISRYNDKELTR